MRNPEQVLNILAEHSNESGYKYERLYRILFNEQMFLVAYQRIHAKPGNMTPGTDGQTEDGMSIDNIYYDNVMHICVYEGRKSLYASDITKQMLSPYVSADFLSKSLFSDMQFIGVGPSGFHYQASVCIPESFVCNIVDLYVSFKGKLTMKAAK